MMIIMSSGEIHGQTKCILLIAMWLVNVSISIINYRNADIGLALESREF